MRLESSGRAFVTALRQRNHSLAAALQVAGDFAQQGPIVVAAFFSEPGSPIGAKAEDTSMSQLHDRAKQLVTVCFAIGYVNRANVSSEHSGTCFDAALPT
jgi:hypothetical protein